MSTIFNRFRAVSTGLVATVMLGGGAAIATETIEVSQPTEGPYFYGETTEIQQPGATYLVMQRHQGEWLGAIYQPNSSFDCFVGEIESQRLAMTIPDAATGETFAHSVSLTNGTLIASNQDKLPAPQLVGFQEMEQMTDLEYRLLNVCQQRLQGQ